MWRNAIMSQTWLFPPSISLSSFRRLLLAVLLFSSTLHLAPTPLYLRKGEIGPSQCAHTVIPAVTECNLQHSDLHSPISIPLPPPQILIHFHIVHWKSPPSSSLTFFKRRIFFLSYLHTVFLLIIFFLYFKKYI